MINRLNHADIVNKLNETRKIFEQYPESGAEYNYDQAYRAVLFEKINELIDKVNELELNDLCKPTICPYPMPLPSPIFPSYPIYPVGYPTYPQIWCKSDSY